MSCYLIRCNDILDMSLTLLQQMHLLILQNHLAERHWVEVNTRVNYPVKTALTWMQQNMVIDLDCPVTKYCVSLMSSKLCQVGIQLHVRAWNSHRIPGKAYSLLYIMHACMHSKKDYVVATIVILVASVNS